MEDDDDEEPEVDVSSDPAALAHAHSAAIGNPLHPLMYSHAVSMATANQLHYTAAALQQQRNLRDNVESNREKSTSETMGDNRESIRNHRDSHISSNEYSTKTSSSVPNGQKDSQKRPRSPQQQSHTIGGNLHDSQPKKPRIEFSLPPTHPTNHIERWQLAATGHV